MKHIVECVPNFSEGRDKKIIDAIAGSISAVADVKLGRVWVPLSAAWALPIIQRVAEKKLGTQLPDTGLPIPQGTFARMTGDALVLEFTEPR